MDMPIARYCCALVRDAYRKTVTLAIAARKKLTATVAWKPVLAKFDSLQATPASLTPRSSIKKIAGPTFLMLCRRHARYERCFMHARDLFVPPSSQLVLLVPLGATHGATPVSTPSRSPLWPSAALASGEIQRS